jgi:D-alanine-D-alanine ligase
LARGDGSKHSAPRLSVAVVQGGPSAEAEVSRASARGVAESLREAGHRVVCLELDASLGESLRSGGFDVVFPVAHGAGGEDGSLQGLLEVQGLPYVGSGVLASALAMDKAVSRRIFSLEGLPVARGISVRRPTDPSLSAEAARGAAERARAEVSTRLVVKPSSQGSALGVARFDDGASLDKIAEGIGATWSLDDAVVIEHFARGREITCGVLDLPTLADGAPLAFPPTEIVSPRDPFYTYEARYAPGRSVHTCPAEIGDSLTGVVQAMARVAHRALACRDLSRVDFIVGDGANTDIVTLLELNTIPGFTPTSLYPEAAAKAGFPLPRLTDSLVRAAHARGPTRRNAPRPLP